MPVGLHDLFLEQAVAVEREMEDVFGHLTKAAACTIVAGSYFARAAGPAGLELRNRACVFDPDGDLIYTQDKVFLTEFEQDQLGLSPGRVEEASLFRVQTPRAKRLGGAFAALTICRDTYHTEWEQEFAKANLWIDIRGNGTAFTPQQEQGFHDALPARLADSGVASGLAACLVGRILDLVWEGRSAILKRTADGVRNVAESASANTGDILYAEIPY